MNFAVVAIDDVQIVPATKLFLSSFFKVVAIVDIQIMPAAKFKLYIGNDLQLFVSIFFCNWQWNQVQAIDDIQIMPATNLWLCNWKIFLYQYLIFRNMPATKSKFFLILLTNS